MPPQVDPAVKANYAALHKEAMRNTKTMAAAYYSRDGAAFHTARNALKAKVLEMRELKKQLKSNP